MFILHKGLWCLMTLDLSKGHLVLCMTILLFCKSPEQTLSHQPGDCRWPLQSSSLGCVDMCGLAYSLYHPRGLITQHQEPRPTNVVYLEGRMNEMEATDDIPV